MNETSDKEKRDLHHYVSVMVQAVLTLISEIIFVY